MPIIAANFSDPGKFRSARLLLINWICFQPGIFVFHPTTHQPTCWSVCLQTRVHLPHFLCLCLDQIMLPLTCVCVVLQSVFLFLLALSGHLISVYVSSYLSVFFLDFSSALTDEAKTLNFSSAATISQQQQQQQQQQQSHPSFDMVAVLDTNVVE